MRPDLENTLRLCPRLPTLSGVALRLVTLARNPDVDLSEITELLTRDPALAARILRVANSPLYSHYQNARRLGQALQVLGLNTTITLSLGFALTRSLRKIDSSGVDLEAFWRRALISGIAARLLGQQCDIPAQEELLLAGLLQDIGRLALDVALPDQYPQFNDSAGRQDVLVALERERLGTDHLEAGAWLMQEWRLPDYFAQGIECSHDRSRRHGLGELSDFMGCVAASGPVADIYLASGASEATAEAQRIATGCLGLTAPDLDAVLVELTDALPEVESLFQISVLSPVQAKGLTEQAREIITCRYLQELERVSSQQPWEMGSAGQVAEQLYDMAYRDPLTDVYNRRHFDQHLASEFAKADANGGVLSLAFLDMDDFKAINDTHGHLAGDTVINQVAATIGGRLRSHDLLARYGGDEFVVLLPGVDRESAAEIVERICEEVALAVPTLSHGVSVPVTLSAGVSTHNGDGQHYSTATELINAADQALCVAKREGRNRVIQVQ